MLEEGGGESWPMGLHFFKTHPRAVGLEIWHHWEQSRALRGQAVPGQRHGCCFTTAFQPPSFACLMPAMARQHLRMPFAWFNTHPTKISCVGICVAFFSGKKIERQGAALHPHSFSYARRTQPRRDRRGRQLRWLHGRIIYKHEPLQNSTPRKKHRSLAISIAIL